MSGTAKLIGLRLFYLLIVILVSGCGRPPTVTTNPAVALNDSRKYVSVCFDAGENKQSDIETAAQEVCDPLTDRLVPARRDRIFNDCPLFKKERITFICEPIK